MLRDFQAGSCCFCGADLGSNSIGGLGNNPSPLKASGKCCAWCDMHLVTPKRIESLLQGVKKGAEDNV